VPLDPALLTADERASFEAQLARYPERFVAREKMAPSLAPCFSVEEVRQGGARLVPKPVVMRVMALWHEGAWFALPGGVARVVSDHSIYRSALRHGAVSKDVWVLAEDMASIPAMPSIVTPPRPTPGDGLALRSRTADDLFWLGRQVERLEAGARQFLATLHRLTSGTMTARNRVELIRLAEALKRSGWISFNLAASPVDGLIFLDGIVEAAANGVVMRNSIDAIHRLMHAARDQLSISMWETLRRLTNSAAQWFGKAERTPDRLLESLDGTIASLAAFGGLVAENMTRGAGWRFLDLGRRIERAIGTCQAIRGVMTGPLDQIEAGFRLTLDLCDSMSGYLLRFPLETYFAHALKFVLTDRSNPRSLLYQLDHIERHLEAQAVRSSIAVEASVVRALIEAVEHSSLDFTRADAEHAIMLLDDLFGLLDRAVSDLMVMSDAITRVYFTHTAPAHPLGFSSRQIPAAAAT